MMLAMPGVCSAGLTMTVLPVTSAATVMPQQIASGKFHGLMTTATPRGWYHCSSSSPMKRPRRCALEHRHRRGRSTRRSRWPRRRRRRPRARSCRLLDHDAREAVALLAHESRRPGRALPPHAWREIAPRWERGVRAGDHLRACSGVRSLATLGTVAPRRGGERLVLRAHREIAQGSLKKGRPSPTHGGDAGESLWRSGASEDRCVTSVGLGRAGGLRPWARGRRSSSAGVGVVQEAGLEPALVAGVLEQAAHEVGHAGDHLADGDVLAHAQAHLGGGVLELVGHAVEHLEFDAPRAAGRAARARRARRRWSARCASPSASFTPPCRRVRPRLGHASRKIWPSARSTRRSATSPHTGQGQPCCSA
jgi:hypothetical protein